MEIACISAQRTGHGAEPSRQGREDVGVFHDDQVQKCCASEQLAKLSVLNKKTCHSDLVAWHLLKRVTNAKPHKR